MAARPLPRQCPRSASAVRLPTCGSKRDPLDLQNPQAMTVPQREVHDGVLGGPHDVYGERERRRQTVQGAGVAAECGLCLDEFLDSGNKVPRNLHCGHTFCTGQSLQDLIYSTLYIHVYVRIYNVHI